MADTITVNGVEKDIDSGPVRSGPILVSSRGDDDPAIIELTHDVACSEDMAINGFHVKNLNYFLFNMSKRHEELPDFMLLYSGRFESPLVDKLREIQQNISEEACEIQSPLRLFLNELRRTDGRPGNIFRRSFLSVVNESHDTPLLFIARALQNAPTIRGKILAAFTIIEICAELDVWHAERSDIPDPSDDLLFTLCVTKNKDNESFFDLCFEREFVDALHFKELPESLVRYRALVNWYETFLHSVRMDYLKSFVRLLPQFRSRVI